VDRITAYLFHAGGSEDPETLVANENKSFQGSIVLGIGFTFDDTDKKGIASPLAERDRLIAQNPRNAERIFPYIGGEEVNDSPTHAHHRYVINFEDFPLRRKDKGHSWFELTEETQRAQLREGIVAPDYPNPVAADWPDLLAIVEERVKPQRSTDNRELYRRYWWHHAEKRVGLYQAVRRVVPPKAIFGRSLTSKHFAFALLPTGIVYDQTLIVFAGLTWAEWAVISSRVHESWSEFFGGTLEDRPRYNVADCFDPFTFPDHTEVVEARGRAYHDFRLSLMARNTEGLTKTYNRFHDPGEMSSDIVELRRCHDAVDRAVLDAYGWTEVRPVCTFVPESDDEENEEDDDSPRKKKRFRYRWPDDIRDDVLARLLLLNQQRHQEEVLAGLHDRPDGSRRRRRTATAVDEEWIEDSLEEQRELEL
jgi:hypothetical protein